MKTHLLFCFLLASFGLFAQQPEPTPQPESAEVPAPVEYDDEHYETTESDRVIIIRKRGGVSAPQIRLPRIVIPDIHIDIDTEELEDELEDVAVELEDLFDLDLDIRIDKSVCDGNPNTYMGVFLENVSPRKAEALGLENPYGRQVKRVVEGTPAYAAGLRGFDYIYGVDEFRVGKQQHLSGIIRRYNPGDRATLKVMRKGNRVDVPITFGDRNENYQDSDRGCDAPFWGVSNNGHHRTYYGDTPVDAEQFMQGRPAAPASATKAMGVRVRMIEGTSADRMGVQSGDVITTIDGNRVYDWTDIETGVQSRNSGDRIEATILRGENTLTVSGPIGSLREADRCDEDEDEEELAEQRSNLEEWREELAQRARAMMEADMEEVTEEDVEEMRDRYDIDMPTDNSLRVEDLEIFPNPSDGPFNVRFVLPDEGATLIRAFNAQGRQIYEFDLGNFSGEFSDRIDLSQNGTGAYFLVITQNGKALTKKIVMSAR